MASITSILCVALVASLLCQSSALSIAWTGYQGDNQWTTQNNWYPNTVPSLNDDVTIDKGSVFVTIPTGVNSLIMGTNVDLPANLTLFHAFTIAASGQLQVKANGNLIVNSGLETVQGVVNIDGTFSFFAGYISGLWTINARGNGYFPFNGQRNIVAGSLTNQGNLYISGVVGLNQSATLVNNANIYATGSSQFMVFDKTNANFNSAQGTLTFTGTILRFQAPSSIATFILNSGNVEIYNQVTITNPMVIPAGSTVSSLGVASISFPTLSGAGAVVASGATTTFATINGISAVTAAGGNILFTQAATVGTFTVSGGTTTFGGNVYAATTNILGGILGGAGSVGGDSVNIESTGCNVGTTIMIPKIGTISKVSQLSFSSLGSLNVAGALAVNNAFNVTGPPGVVGVNISGTVNVAAGLTFFSQNINVFGQGAVNVMSSGNFKVSTATVHLNNITLAAGSNFWGSNSNLNVATITAAATVKASVGDYRLVCPDSCSQVVTPGGQSAQNFQFSG